MGGAHSKSSGTSGSASASTSAATPTSNQIQPPKAAYRFSRILRDSAAWVNGSSKTDIDVLFSIWRAKIPAVSVYMEQNRVAEAEGGINEPRERHDQCMNVPCQRVPAHPPPEVVAARYRSRWITTSRWRPPHTKGGAAAGVQRRGEAIHQESRVCHLLRLRQQQTLEEGSDVARQALMRAEEDLEWAAN